MSEKYVVEYVVPGTNFPRVIEVGLVVREDALPEPNVVVQPLGRLIDRQCFSTFVSYLPLPHPQPQLRRMRWANLNIVPLWFSERIQS